jgi:signal transduction histidine kinase
MARSESRLHLAPLIGQLGWFIRLRWIAGAAVVAGSLADARWLHWYPYPHRTLAVGCVIVAYNVALRFVLGRARREPLQDMPLLLLAWVQLLADMLCLTVLIVWTGGADSPLRGFFVFHMVFASLMLPRWTAFGGAFVAIVMMPTALVLTEPAPMTIYHRLELIGWAMMLLMTVYLANNITRSLRRQRRRLLRQNRDIKRMTRQIRRHQRAIVQHEKMIAIGQMAAGITHEIANPLANMDSLLQLAQRKPEKMNSEAMATLREQIARMNQIIAQMKAFAHPDNLHRQSAPLNEVIARVLEMVKFDRRMGKVKVVKQLSPAVGVFQFVPQAIQQVLVNLIANALDAMADRPEAVLTVRTERKENWAIIEIGDTGHGIRPEHMHRLSEPFFTTKPVGQGTGLGLSISYNLVQKQGGNVSVKSQVGKGTTFIIRLPMGEMGDSNKRESAGAGVVAGENSGL